MPTDEAKRRARDVLDKARWQSVSTILDAAARYVEHLAASEPEIRLAPGDEAAEEIAAQLRREAAGGAQALRHFGLIEATLDMMDPSDASRYEAIPTNALARQGDEVLVDGVWLRWVGGDVSSHPSWQGLRRRPWRRVKK